MRQVDYDALYDEGGEYAPYLSMSRQRKHGQLPRAGRSWRTALKEIGELKPESLLEVGCGVGGFLAHVVRLGIDCTGIEPSHNAVEHAKKYTSCDIHIGRLAEDVLCDRKFDVVCSWEVIEHVADVQLFLHAIKQRLKPGGYFYLSTPNYDSTWMWRDMEADPRSRPPVHLTFFNAQALENLLTEMGFEDVVIRHYSLPVSAAIRSGGRWGRWFVYPDALIRKTQRTTLLGRARLPNSDSQAI